MDDVHFNKPAAAGGYGWLHALNAALLLGLWAFAIGAWSGLPDQVPGHIGPGGVTRWAAKQNSPWLILPIIASVNAAVMYGIATLAKSSPDSFNVPAKKELMQLPREGQLYAIAPMRGFMYAMATWLLLLTGFLQLEMYRIAHAGPGADAGAHRLLVFTGVMLAAVLVMAFRSARIVKRRIGEWRQLHEAR